MNRRDARLIAERITNQQIQEMFDVAEVSIKDWTKVSIVNKSMTKGTAWNILANDFDIDYKYHILAKTNFVREFGEFLPDELMVQKEKRKKTIPTHQEPVFKNKPSKA